MVVLRGILVGLVCGAMLGALIVFIVGGPTSLFSNKYSPLGSEKEFVRGALVYFTLIGSTAGAVVGLVVGSIIAFTRR